MTGEGVKREIGVWYSQETRPDPINLCEGRLDNVLDIQIITLTQNF